MKHQSSKKMVWDWVQMCYECIGDKDDKLVRFGLHCVYLLIIHLLETDETDEDILNSSLSLYYPVVNLKKTQSDILILRHDVLATLKKLYNKKKHVPFRK